MFFFVSFAPIAHAQHSYSDNTYDNPGPPPPGVTGDIWGTPNPCYIPSGGTVCTSNISWWTSHATTTPVIKIRELGAVFTSGYSGTNVVAPWIPASGYHFEIWVGSNFVDSVFVKGVTGQISANPNPCTIAVGSNACTSTISWNTQNAQGNVTVWVRGGGLVSSGLPSGSVSAPWIDSNGLWLDLYDGASPTTPLNSVFVYGTYAQPGGFGVTALSPACAGTNGQITLNWGNSANASHYVVFYRNQANPANVYGGWDVGNTNTFTLTTGPQVYGGAYVDFVVAAKNPAGAFTYSNTAPFVPNTPGGWTSGIYGWTQFPDCSGPGSFHQSTPIPSCASVGNPTIHVSWDRSLSNPATDYYVYYIDQSVGVMAGGYSSGGLLYYDLTSAQGLQSGHQYAFIIYAIKAGIPTGTFSDNSTWSSYVPFYTCNAPIVNLTIDNAVDTLKNINSGGSIQLIYSYNYAYKCTSSVDHPVAGSTTPWTNLFPSNTPVNPMGAYGAVSVTLYNDPSHGNNASYLFTLLCTNDALIPSVNAQRTVNVTVQTGQAPFIQTTQGDVHSNKNVNF